MQLPSVLDEQSPYYQVHSHIPRTWWFVTWREIVRRMREQPDGLPAELRQPGALVGLSVGLFFRQAALTCDALVPISWRDDVSEWAL